MPYGTLKVDTITYTNGGVDATTTVSGLAAGSGFVNISTTGTISGATITGNTGNFTTITAVTGIFTTTLSGATISGNTAQFTNVTGGTAGFTTVTGTTVTGTTAQFVTVSGTTVTGANVNDDKGNVRAIPQNSQTTGYTLVAADAGKHVFTVTGVTVPSGVFSVGDAISIYNNTTDNITITQGTNVTLRQAGASGTGNRTLAQRGLATVLCVSGSAGTEFVIGGAGLS
jgi:hypothetical protein